MDVVTAYLNGTVDEELYMEIPECFETVLEDMVSGSASNDITESVLKICKQQLLALREGNKVCKLKKSRYGLKK